MMIAENTVAPVLLRLIVTSTESPAERSMFSRWQAEYENMTSKTVRRQKILDAVRDGYDSFAEISNATGIPEPTVRKLIPRLVSSGSLISRKIKPPKQKPEYRFELAEAD